MNMCNHIEQNDILDKFMETSFTQEKMKEFKGLLMEGTIPYDVKTISIYNI